MFCDNMLLLVVRSVFLTNKCIVFMNSSLEFLVKQVILLKIGLTR